MKIQGQSIPPKDSNNLVTDTKGMKTYNLPDKEFKIIVLRKLSELLGNRKTIQQNQEYNTWAKWEV